ncbi:MAG: hypothetical protein M1821_002175 [Bathelium mastoideum]|nr:MAG: hypothetical protein M1821_002175 [Bathelium mastoideum]
MAPHIAARRDASQPPLITATSPSPSHSLQEIKTFPNVPREPSAPLRSPYLHHSPQSPTRSPGSPQTPHGSAHLPRVQPQPRALPLKALGVPCNSRFSDFSVDSEETRIRALYNRITAAQPISYKSVFVDVEEKQDPRPSGIRLKWWLFELLAWTFSLATLCAFVLLLHQYNGKMQSDWPSRAFTLNALVALIATLTRVSLIVPIAQAISQAKWDWFSNKDRHDVRGGKPLADLETFDNASRGPYGGLGLLWRLKGRHLPAIGAVLMTLSLGFDTFSQQVLAVDYRPGPTQRSCGSIPHASSYQGSSSDAGIPGLSISAKAAVINGALSIDVTPVQANCPSGDCSWPTTPTIGVCGTCIDISSKIQTPSLNTNRQDQPQVLTITNGSNFISNPSTANDSSIDMLLIDFNIIASQGQAIVNPVATECALWFCLQALGASQVDGVQNTTAIQTWSEASSPSHASSSYTFTSVPPSFNLSPDSNYTVTSSAFDAYSSYLPTIINGSVSSTSDGYAPSSDFAEAIWLSLSDLDVWIQHLATSLTNHLRLAGTNSLLASDDQTEIHRYDGTAYETAAFVRVRWAWFAFPAGMVLLSLLYLIASMLSAWQSGTHIWKSSALPLLLADVDPGVKLQADRGVHEPGGIAKAAGTRRVSLNGEDGRWVFRATDGSPAIR